MQRSSLYTCELDAETVDFLIAEVNIGHYSMASFRPHLSCTVVEIFRTS